MNSISLAKRNSDSRQQECEGEVGVAGVEERREEEEAEPNGEAPERSDFFMNISYVFLKCILINGNVISFFLASRKAFYPFIID